MTLPDTRIMWRTLAPDVRDALSVCPPWCAEPPGHGQTDAEIVGHLGLIVDHLGPEHVALAPPAGSAYPTTVQLRRWQDYSDGVVGDEGIKVLVRGVWEEEGMTVSDAIGLALTILEVAAGAIPPK